MMLPLLANLLLLQLCLQAAFAESTINATKELGSIENWDEGDFEALLRTMDTNKTGTIPKIVLEDMKKGAEIIIANVTDLGKKEEDGEITVKKPNECANEEEQILHILMSKFDEDHNGKISPSEQIKMKENYESNAIILDGFIKKLPKDGRITIEEFMALINEAEKNRKENKKN